MPLLEGLLSSEAAEWADVAEVGVGMVGLRGLEEREGWVEGFGRRVMGGGGTRLPGIVGNVDGDPMGMRMADGRGR